MYIKGITFRHLVKTGKSSWYARSAYLSLIIEDRLVAGFMQVIKLCLLGPSVSQESNVIIFKVGIYHFFFMLMYV